jgi:hypothetical protein
MNFRTGKCRKVKDYHPKKLLEVLMVRKLLKGLKPDSKFYIKKENLSFS